MSDLDELRDELRAFAAARDWEQFHTPKNLAMALAGEAGELLAEFQWLTPEQSSRVMATEQAEAIRDEIADVLIYLTRLADVLDISPVAAAIAKVEHNERRFPPTAT